MVEDRAYQDYIKHWKQWVDGLTEEDVDSILISTYGNDYEDVTELLASELEMQATKPFIMPEEPEGFWWGEQLDPPGLIASDVVVSPDVEPMNFW